VRRVRFPAAPQSGTRGAHCRLSKGRPFDHNSPRSSRRRDVSVKPARKSRRGARLSARGRARFRWRSIKSSTPPRVIRQVRTTRYPVTPPRFNPCASQRTPLVMSGDRVDGRRRRGDGQVRRDEAPQYEAEWGAVVPPVGNMPQRPTGQCSTVMSSMGKSAGLPVAKRALMPAVAAAIRQSAC
jgi:hypothetical protein